MQAHFDQQSQAGGHHPLVHPAGAAQALSIPKSQAERMFLVAETQGLLGAQQIDGAGRSPRRSGRSRSVDRATDALSRAGQGNHGRRPG
jgi:hypothetical protein